MALIDVNWNPPRRQLRQFAVLFLIFIGGLGTVLYFKGKPLLVSEILWNLSWVVCLAGLIYPPLVRPVYVAMMAVALPIGFVVSTILLVIIYYLILTPIGLAMRLFGYDPMRMRRVVGTGSLWIERPKKINVRRYFRQY
jgi:hypothetical protein